MDRPLDPMSTPHPVPGCFNLPQPLALPAVIQGMGNLLQNNFSWPPASCLVTLSPLPGCSKKDTSIWPLSKSLFLTLHQLGSGS